MNKILLDAPMPIMTPRLVIKPPEHGMGHIMNAAILETKAQLAEWFPWVQHSLEVEQNEIYLREKLAEFYERTNFTFWVFDKQGHLLGATGIHPVSWLVPNCHIGYWLRASAQGNGYIKEIVTALAKYAHQQLQFKAVYIHVDSENEPSLKAARSVQGFVEEGRISGGIDKPNSITLRTKVIFTNTNPDDLEDMGVSW